MNVKKIPLCFDVSDEKRGYVIQNLQESKAFEGYCIKDIVIQSINPNKCRGYHSHKEKTEWFMALMGRAKLITTTKTADVVPKPDDLEIYTFESDCLKPKYVYMIPPNLGHFVVNDSKEEVFVMESFSNKEHKTEEDISYKKDVWGPIIKDRLKQCASTSLSDEK